MKALLLDRRFVVLLALVVGVAMLFWLSSRYPSLDTKALMAGDLDLQDGLSFDVWLRHAPGESWITEVVVTYLNWLHTNRQGMAFGLVLAVLVMSLVPLVREHVSTRLTGWSASVMGLFIGAPLGVCVNCAAPIAFGLYRSGARAELAVAAMISSPVFNVIVLSMLLSLFAWPLVAIKLALTLVVIFVSVPLLLRLFDGETWSGTVGADVGRTVGPIGGPIGGPAISTGRLRPPDATPGEGRGALRWVATTLSSNARYLLLGVVPIMLLAGLLGSLVVTLAPWDLLPGAVAGEAWWKTLLTIALLAVFGLVLPVPIAFDVLICATLLNAGVPVKYVAVLLFTLGTFSVYSFMVLWKAGARRLAVGLSVNLMLVGALAGVLSHFADQWYTRWQLEHNYRQLAGEAVLRHAIEPPDIGDGRPVSPPLLSFRDDPDRPGIASMPLPAREATDGEAAGFRMERLADDGFRLHAMPLIESLTLPFSQLNGIAAGDVNNDNWEDILLGTSQGLYLYLNVGGRFSPVALPFQSSVSGRIGAIGLVDLDNDGWLDIFFSEAWKGSYLSYNREGRFQAPQRHLSHAPVIGGAVGFGDLDHNGELDIVEGQHSGLSWKRRSADASRNILALQHDGTFAGRFLPGPPGETLSILLSDVNGDSWLDVFVGNDFDEPDVYYHGSEGGVLTPWSTEGIRTTETTMSIDSADIDNDLQLETYHGQITRNPASPPAVIPELSLADLQARHCVDGADEPYEGYRCTSLGTRQVASSGRGSAGCMNLPRELRFDCLAHHWYIDADRPGQVHEEQLLSRWYADYAALYARVYAHERDEARHDDPADIRGRNLLYEHASEADGSVPADVAETMGVSIAGWTWNARFADLDGDQWQDLYAANGWHEKLGDTSNVWFRNIGGERFVEATGQAGLTDFEPTRSSVFTDVDNDGDPDLITFSALGKVRTYIATGQANDFLQIALEDHVGNRSGIGSRVIVHYGDGLRQMREVKASGGYLSQDSALLQFGLGEHRQVDAIEVHWSSGESSVHEGPFEARTRYRIRRDLSSR